MQALAPSWSAAREHEELAHYYLSCLDPSAEPLPLVDERRAPPPEERPSTTPLPPTIGADEPLVLLGAAYHLWRAGSGQCPTLIGLLRSAGFAARLAGVAHVPPLPVVLIEALCCDEHGRRVTDIATQLSVDFGDIIDACVLEGSQERADGVSFALRRVAKRLELRHLTEEAAAARRRKEANKHVGKTIEDVAAYCMQRSARNLLRALQRKQDAARPVALMTTAFREA